MKLNAYLSFNGNCAEAFKFYQSVLGGKLDMMPFGETPACDHVPKELHSKIMHACLHSDDFSLMASDTTPDHPYEGIKGCSVAIHADSIPESKRIYDALSANGQIIMPLQETFWSPSFGMAVDHFGVSWIINTETKQ